MNDINENGWPVIQREKEIKVSTDYNEGYEDGKQDAEFEMSEHLVPKLKFAIAKIKEAQERQLSMSDLYKELESEYLTHI